MDESGVLDIEVAQEDDSSRVVAIRGDLDPYTAPMLEAALKSLENETIVRKVVLDLSDVGFIDSSGLRVIISSLQSLNGRGAQLLVRSPSEAARRLFEIVHLVDLLEEENA